MFTKPNCSRFKVVMTCRLQRQAPTKKLISNCKPGMRSGHQAHLVGSCSTLSGVPNVDNPGPRARTGEHVPGVVGTFGGEGRTHLSLMASGGAKRILTENTAARETRFLGALVGRSTRFSNGAPRSPKANPQKMKRIGLMNAPFFSIGVLRSPEGSPPKVNLIGLTNASLQIHLSPKRVPAKTVPFGFRFNVQEHMEPKRESQLVFEFHVNLQGGSCILRSPDFDFAGCRVPLERWSVLLEAGIAWQGTEDVVRRASSCSLHASGNG